MIIGNEDYGFIPDVPFATRDAQAFYNFLVYTRGVPMDRIRFLNDKSKEVIQQAVADTAGMAEADGTFWIYFAGHGAADPSTGARLLLGKDVDVDPAVFVARGVDVAKLQADAAGSGAYVVMLIDACFNGAGRDGAPIVAGKRFAVPAYSVQAAGAVSEWAATSPEQLAGGLPAVQHGAFTYFAIGAMRGWADGEVDGQPDDAVTLAEAQAWVSRSMRAAQIIDQTPVVSGSLSVPLSGSDRLEAAPPIDSMVRLVRAAAPATMGHSEVQLVGSNANVDFAVLAAQASAAQAAAAQAEAARTEAEHLLQAERARRLTAAATGITTAATRDFAAMAGIVSEPVTPQTRPVLEAFVAQYGSSTVTVDGVSQAVTVPEVERVKALLTPRPAAPTLQRV